MNFTEQDLPEAHELGCMLDDLPDGTPCDNLAIIIATYFSGHRDRPDDDEENEDNHYWGDWVIEKCHVADKMLVAEIREKVAQKVRIREIRQKSPDFG